VVVSGLPGAGKSTLARRLGELLTLPVLSHDTVKEGVVDGLAGADLDRFAVRTAATTVIARLAAAQPTGCLIDVWVDPVADAGRTADVLRESGRAFLEIVCLVSVDVAIERYAARTRHPAHDGLTADIERRMREAAPHIGPCGLGPHRDVDTTRPLDDAVLADLIGWLRDPGAAE